MKAVTNMKLVEENNPILKKTCELFDFNEPIIDEREEYFVAYKITNHDTPKTKANLNDKAKIIPK